VFLRLQSRLVNCLFITILSFIILFLLVCVENPFNIDMFLCVCFCRVGEQGRRERGESAMGR
jgi:hypothetical protein